MKGTKCEVEGESSKADEWLFQKQRMKRAVRLDKQRDESERNKVK